MAGERVGKEIGPRALAEEVDRRLRTGDIAAECFAQSAGEDIGANAGMGRRAFAFCAHEADGVAIVDHHRGVVLIGKRADFRQVGEGAIHAENLVGGDRDMVRTVFARLFEPSFEIGHVVVQIAVSFRFAESDTVDDRGMVQRVGNDRVLRPEERFK